MRRAFNKLAPPEQSVAGWSGPSALLVSALGDDTGGGLYAIQDDTLSMLDEVSSTGLAVSDDGERLARLYWMDRTNDVPAELLIYDRSGPLLYRRLSDVRQPHSIMWDGDNLVLVSTGTNAIVWVDPNHGVVDLWQAPGIGDCWHLNSLLRHEGRLLVSGFGRFEEAHAWIDQRARFETGFVTEPATGRDVLSGLSSPHNPLWLDGCWLICNSAAGELRRVDSRGEVVARREFNGWTRGLAFDEQRIFVGVSAHRMRGEADRHAFVAALRRDSLEEVARWALPCREVYDLVFAPLSLVGGLTPDWSAAIRRERVGRP